MLRDPERLAAAMRLGLVDAPPEESFDRMTRLASRLVGAPVSLVSIVTDDRQVFKSQVGLPEPWASARETPLSHSFCQHVVETQRPLIVSDAREDEVLRDNLAIRDLDVIAYCGVPIRDGAGRVLGSFCVIDSDPRDWTEADLAVLQDLVEVIHDELRLRETVSLLGAAIEEQKNLLSTIAHDLRNPLSTIAGVASTLLDHPDLLAGRRVELLQLVERAADRVVRMTEELVAGRRDDRVREFDVVELMAASVRSANLGRPGGTSRVRLLDAAPVGMIGPPDDVERIIGNLVVNALNYAGPAATVTVAVAAQDGEVVLTVADDGVGIPAGELERLREPFQRGADAGATPGFGLGLHIVWSLTEELGGAVEVRSELGEGTTFTVTLPARPGDEGPEATTPGR